MPKLTAERLRELFHYDPDIGLFVRLHDSWAGRHRNVLVAKAGTVADLLMSTGYLRVVADGRQYTSHRLAWLYMTGDWPIDMIDHIDGCRVNNSWSNLRDVTNAQNMQNCHRPHRDTKSGLLGAHWDGARKQWQSKIFRNGKIKCLGRFPTPEEAHAAYVSAKQVFDETGGL